MVNCPFEGGKPWTEINAIKWKTIENINNMAAKEQSSNTVFCSYATCTIYKHDL